MKDEWLIWSIEHEGWWRPHRNGYTQELSGAGIYTFKDACEIVDNANINRKDVPNESMIHNYQ